MYIYFKHVNPEICKHTHTHTDTQYDYHTLPPMLRSEGNNLHVHNTIF